jgi:hypothetical protein
MNFYALALSIVSLYATHAFAEEKIVITPISKKMGSLSAGARKSENVTLRGVLHTIPMGGAKLTLQSTNYGQVILFSPLALDAQIQKRLEKIEASGISVVITATMNTICAERELKAEVLGCRILDNSKTITVKTQ